MKLLCSKSIFLSSTLLLLLSGKLIFAQGLGAGYPENYEDYLHYRTSQNVIRDDPLSDVDNGRSVYENLRGYIRDEIDQTMNQKTYPENVNTSKMSNEIRKIVREEIRAAANIQTKKYLSPRTVEFGGSISADATFIRDDSGSSGLESGIYISLSPFVNVFLSRLMAISGHIKCEYDVKNVKSVYNVGIGPMLATGLNQRDSIVFYISLYGGVGANTFARTRYGFRYGNDVGLKLQLSPGSFLNVGLSVTMNTRKLDFSFFDMTVTPTIGISTWF